MRIFLFVLATAAITMNLFSSDAQIAEIIETHYSVTISGGDFIKNSIMYSYQNFYDSSGNKVLDVRFDSLGDEIKRYVYEYDLSGKRTEQNQFTPEGLLVRKIVYTYDDAGRLTEDNSYDSLGNHEKRYTYIYDAKGLLVEDRSHSNSGQLLKKHVYYYDEEGSKTSCEIYDSTESLVETIEYSFSSINENMVWIEERYYDSDGNIFQTIDFDFEYDEHGRWTVKKVYINEDVVEIIERQYVPAAR